jgi:hypothetical protein
VNNGKDGLYTYSAQLEYGDKSTYYEKPKVNPQKYDYNASLDITLFEGNNILLSDGIMNIDYFDILAIDDGAANSNSVWSSQETLKKIE